MTMSLATQTVYTWTCDENGVVEVTDTPALPAGWLAVAISDQHGNQMAADLCQTCAAAFQAALTSFKATVA